MRKPYGILWLLVVMSAALLSLPWLIPHCGWIALIAFIPLMCADRVASQNGLRHFWIWHYSCFVLWNAATTFWVGGATVGGAIFAIAANALQMSLIFGLFRLSKKRFGGILPYIFLALAWIAWERWYLVQAQISWPWLVLGNAFARSIKTIQWYEFTGTLGGSLWVWITNLSLFGLMVSVLEGTFFRRNRLAKTSALLGTVLAFGLPFAVSALMWKNFREDSSGSVEVVIAQPNFDPYQKFESLSQKQQNDILLGLFDKELASRGNGWNGLLIAPETFTNDIFLGNMTGSPTWNQFQEFLGKHPGADLLFGASTYEYFAQRSSPNILAREFGNGWIENHNSAFVTDSSGRFDQFHKSKLVVGVEMTPYPQVFVPIDNLLGGVMGRCIGQGSVSTMRYFDSDSAAVPFGCAICYESIYPEYCTEYVRRGAEFMTVITNDAWWGNTPGYRQHASYASLRAIELRRDIARCGNTGISSIINQRGEVLQKSNWWKRETLCGKVNLSEKQTFFVQHGDIIGRICTLACLLLAAWLLVALVVKR